VTSFLNAVSFGETSCAIFWSSSVVSAAFRLKKILVILFNFSPTQSKATVVFLKFGGAELFMIYCISAFAISIPFSMAGLKSEVEILEKGGVLKFCNSGFIFSMNWGKNQ